MNMEFTHNYKRQTTFSSFRSLLAQRVVQFVTNNPDVFEAIARTGAPFGGISLPTSQRTAGVPAAQATRDELAQLQQQLDVLTEQVTRLHNSLSETQNVPQEQPVEKARKSTSSTGKQIGIDRFRALQGNASLMA